MGIKAFFLANIGLNRWKERIHADELIKHVMGKDIDAGPFVNYPETKWQGFTIFNE